MRIITSLKYSLIAVALYAVNTHAAFIDGQMGYSAKSDPALQWSVDPLTNIVTIGHGEVDTGIGDLSLLPAELAAPVTFNYGAGFAPLTIWSAGGFSFELQSVTVVYEADTFLVLSGAGTLHSSNPGFASTAAQWQFSGNVFTYSAGTLATPTIVPLPASLWLFASATAGLYLSRFKQAHKSC